MRFLSAAGILAALIVALLLAGCTSPAVPTVNLTNPPDNSTQACPAIYQPVCGADNITYPNACLAQVAGAYISHQGECTGPSTDCIDSDKDDIFEPGNATNSSSIKEDVCADDTHVTEYDCQGTGIVGQVLPCPQGYMCQDGACRPAQSANNTCQELGNSSDKFSAGGAYYNGKTYSDECPMVDQVKKYSCRNGTMSSTNMVCPTGWQCVGGACKEMPPVCTDTDGGYNLTVQGSTTVRKGYSLISTGSDYCVNQTDLMEYYCVNGSMVGNETPCGNDYVCKDGACVYQQCTDSGDGQNLFVAGTLTKGSVVLTDSCEGAYNVVKNYCLNNAVKTVVSTCPSGYMCSGGKCVEEVCTDSDGGLNYGTAGTVSKGGAQYSDYCSGATMLVEYYCDNNTVRSQTYNCQGPCDNGRCLPS
jgi:hypothetical protein